MDQPQNVLTVAFIGAGGINFGARDSGAPWDHATRIETLSLEINLKVVGISDLSQSRLETVIQERKQGATTIWNDVRGFTDTVEMLDETKPMAVFIGLPPFAHGDIEMQCAMRGIHMFIEKPLSVSPPEEVKKVIDEVERNGVIVSVGYMLRYHNAVNYVKEYIAQNKPIISVSATYNSSYVTIKSPFWWDNSKSGGPVVEQGTHFIDLLRYFSGEAKLNTLHCTKVVAETELGKLERPPDFEQYIPSVNKMNRCSSAQWQFENGTLASFKHGMLMMNEDGKYFNEFEIWCEGVIIKLRDLYTTDCHVEIYTTSGHPQTLVFPDDPYLTEDRAFLMAIINNDTSEIRSSYQDAFETYKLSYIIEHSPQSKL